MLPDDLKYFIPEIEEYETTVVEQLYAIALLKHPTEEEKILRYYFTGYLLTCGEEGDIKEVKISNVNIKGSSDNLYWQKYLALLDVLNKKYPLEIKRTKIVVI